VVLDALLLAEQARQFELMRAGCGQVALSATALRASALVAIPAAVVATAWHCRHPGSSGALPWWLAAMTLAAALAGLPLIAAARLQSPARRLTRRPHRAAPRSSRRLVIKAALIAAAAAALSWPSAGRGRSGPGRTMARRCLSRSGRDHRVALHRWWPAGCCARPGCPRRRRLGLARAARSSLIAILPAFALVLVLATISFGGLVRAAITRGEVAASGSSLAPMR
jgi:hypothetical protein